jgi:adenylate cyclase class 2
MAHSSEEVEIKLAVSGPAAARRILAGAGFRVSSSRVFEANDVWDTPDHALRNRRNLLRLRQAGKRQVLTFKGTPVSGPHKRREELEVDVSSSRTLALILERLGFTLQFRYEKHRTEFQVPGQKGTATLDETPIGTFLELEGQARWIDRTAKLLGFRPEDYITRSYGTLYFEYCREHDIEPANMVFNRSKSRKRTSK